MGARRCRMRDPFDDPVFRALADTHDVRPSDMPCSIANAGWNAGLQGPCRSMPSGFPDFTFQVGTGKHCAVLMIELREAPTLRYAQAARRYVHMDAAALNETLKTTLAGRRIDDVVAIPGLCGMTIDEVTETRGTLSLRLKERTP